MWTIKKHRDATTGELLYWIGDDACAMAEKHSQNPKWCWPLGIEMVDFGAAQLMCDVFNGRDYPEEFHHGSRSITEECNSR